MRRPRSTGTTNGSTRHAHAHASRLNGTGTDQSLPRSNDRASSSRADAHSDALAACEPDEDLLVLMLDGVPESVASGPLSASNLSVLSPSALEELILPSWSPTVASEWGASLRVAWKALPTHWRDTADACLTKQMPLQDGTPLGRHCSRHSSDTLTKAAAWYDRWFNASSASPTKSDAAASPMSA
jgi:hypothetical protein